MAKFETKVVRPFSAPTPAPAIAPRPAPSRPMPVYERKVEPVHTKYNENHDPDNGQFTFGDGGSGGGGSGSVERDGFSFTRTAIDKERDRFQSRFGVNAGSPKEELATAIMAAAHDEGDSGTALYDVLAEQYGFGGLAGARRHATRGYPD